MSRLVSDRAWGVMTVWQEARGECYLGKVAVAEVIQRRAKNKFFSDGTIPGTVLRRFQFSGWNTQDPNRVPASLIDSNDPQVVECMKAWDEAAAGSNIVPECMHYYNGKALDREPLWAHNAKIVAEIGNHKFVIPEERVRA